MEDAYQHYKMSLIPSGSIRSSSEKTLTIPRGSALPVFHPEFGRFMLEATPGRPWGIGFKDLLDVEPNMKWRCVIQNLKRVHGADVVKA